MGWVWQGQAVPGKVQGARSVNQTAASADRRDRAYPVGFSAPARKPRRFGMGCDTIIGHSTVPGAEAPGVPSSPARKP